MPPPVRHPSYVQKIAPIKETKFGCLHVPAIRQKEEKGLTDRSTESVKLSWRTHPPGTKQL